MTFDLETWATEEKAKVDLVKAKLERLLGALRAHTIRGSADDAAAIRRTLEEFEELEMGVSGDLGLLQPFYDALGQEEYGWGEASDEEVMAAARKAFGGES